MEKMLVAIAIVVMTAGVARAQAPGMTGPKDEVRTERYGATIAAVDIAAVGLVVVGAWEANEHSDSVLGLYGVAVGVGVYAFGPAIVHHRHGRTGAAVKSILLRTLLPAAAGGLLFVAGLSDENREYPAAAVLGGVLGTGLGIATAMGVDWFVLAKERHVTPMVAPTSGGAMLGLAGGF